MTDDLNMLCMHAVDRNTLEKRVISSVMHIGQYRMSNRQLSTARSRRHHHKRLQMAETNRNAEKQPTEN